MSNRLPRLLFRLISIAFILVLALPGGTGQAAAQNTSQAPLAARTTEMAGGPSQTGLAAAPVHPAAPSSGPGPQVVWATGPSLSEPLRSMPASPLLQPQGETILNPQNRILLPHLQNATGAGSFDPSIVQSSPIGAAMPAAITSFDGVSFNGYLPPDTEGALGYDPVGGKKYYMQWVNVNFQIWDVTNPAAVTSVLGPVAGNTLWSGFGGLCQTNNEGDPIVLFDQLAGRWIASQFANDSTHNDQCIAVSTSADPTGTWNRYSFLISTTKFNDYPKFGVWPDGYYMTVNQFTGNTFSGVGAAVFERQAMLSGSPARMVYFDIGAVNTNFSNMQPSVLDGPAPAPGTPNYFAEWDDSTWLGDPTDIMRIWNFHVDWSNTANSTFGADASYTPNQLIPTTNVDPNMCNYSSSCIPQPGKKSKLDALSDRLMYRLQYRNFGSYQTLVGNRTVDTNGANLAGIYWFEMRNTGAGWAFNQQGTYAPADSNNRWMGSIAMDGMGDMALGYSVSSRSTYPSVRYTGRLSTDTPGTLPQGESSLVIGAGSQTSSSSRWGDYSTMSLDPADDCTFWYTQEYYSTTSSAGWKTRIGSFSFPACQQFTVSTSTTGSGTITSSPAGINCGATCSYTFPGATVVTLTATPAPQSVFTGWSGGCSGFGACFVTMSSAEPVIANFAPYAVFLPLIIH